MVRRPGRRRAACGQEMAQRWDWTGSTSTSFNLTCAYTLLVHVSGAAPGLGDTCQTQLLP